MDNHTDEMTMHALREAALIRMADEHLPSECLTDETLIAIADGRAAEKELRVWTPHLSRCRHCQHELASLVRALNDAEVMRAALVDVSPRRRFLVIGFPLVAAAAAVFAFAVKPEHQITPVAALGRAPVVSTHRAPVLTPGAAPVGVSPVGVVTGAAELRWSAVPHADLYHVTLFDAVGRTLFEGDANEPGLTLPDSLSLTRARKYLWQVQARIGFDRWVSSDLVEFRIVPPTQ